MSNVYTQYGSIEVNMSLASFRDGRLDPHGICNGLRRKPVLQDLCYRFTD
jgi:hypothetical protein